MKPNIKWILTLACSTTLVLALLAMYSYLQIYGSVEPTSGTVSKLSHFVLSKLGDRQASHALASIRLFRSNDFHEQKRGFQYLETEYEQGSYYSGGKLGWAYQRGLGVEKDLEKALSLYREAASHGMTYWQFLLAHAHQQGYLGLEQSAEMYEYWLNFSPRVHIAMYECWVANYYSDGTFPSNEQLQEEYQERCEDGA